MTLNPLASRFYGPSLTPVSMMVAPLIDRYLEARLKVDELEYDSVPDTYLFQRNGRALTSSQWSQFVKQAFSRSVPDATPRHTTRVLTTAFVPPLTVRHTPNGEAPPPKGSTSTTPLNPTHTRCGPRHRRVSHGAS